MDHLLAGGIGGGGGGTSASNDGTSATANTGGGGGAAARNSGGGQRQGGRGGSGVVIIRLPKSATLTKVSGTPSLPTPVEISGTDDHYYEFLTVGTITVKANGVIT